MFDVSWLIFITSSIAIILAPGQDMVLVMSRGLGQGALAGIVTAAGVSIGLLGHTLLATLGLGALLQTSDFAFLVMKYVGAAYLTYLGLRLILSNSTKIEASAIESVPYRRLFAMGAFSNISNPKIALFYFAFLPQFVPASVQNPTVLIFILGFLFAALTFLIKVPVGYFAGTLSGWFRDHPNSLSWVYRISGAVLIGFGLRLAFSDKI